MKISGQEIDARVIEQMQEVIDREPELSRAQLSRRICEELKWRSRNGRLQEVSCRKALVKLHRGGVIRMTEAKAFPAPRRVADVSRKRVLESSPEMHGRLKDFQPVEVVVIENSDRAESRIWNELMGDHHYLGAGPLCGSQIRYLIRNEKQGWLGGLAFSAAAWKVQPRDEWIGWSNEGRQKQLDQIVNNSRFLILPHLHVPHLASHVLGLVLRRLRSDWKQRYGYEPALVETFVEARRFKGTSYRAANFIDVGQTQGRGRQDRGNRQELPVKHILVYDWKGEGRQNLCKGDEGLSRAPLAAKDWAENEFGGARLPDKRLKKRLLTMARDFYARPQAQLPEACQGRAKTKAAYRFLDHPGTTLESLLEPHYQATRQRLAEHKVVLAVQDTTSLNYTAHPFTEDLGPIGTKVDGSLGLLVHDTMAFSVEGTPLGLMDVQCWARDPAEFGKHHQRKQRPIEEKESFKWLKSFQQVVEAQRRYPDTTLISVGDREADIYELFALALQNRRGPKLLVRSEHDRLLTEGQGHLCAVMAGQPVAATQDIQLPRRNAQPARTAHLEIRFAPVTLKPPQGKTGLPPLKLWAVLAEETAAPPAVKPLRWMLLTTCEVSSLPSALEKIAWYRLRWGVEVYHRTLKSGCKIEQRQLGAADRIATCLAIDMVVAWRIFHLAKLGRECPDIPCTVLFEEFEWKALYTCITKTTEPPASPPSLKQAVRMVATLGGFLGRKADGDPGNTTLWRGFHYLSGIAVVWESVVLRYAPHLLSTPVSSTSTYG